METMRQDCDILSHQFCGHILKELIKCKSFQAFFAHGFQMLRFPDVEGSRC